MSNLRKYCLGIYLISLCGFLYPMKYRNEPFISKMWLEDEGINSSSEVKNSNHYAETFINYETGESGRFEYKSDGRNVETSMTYNLGNTHDTDRTSNQSSNGSSSSNNKELHHEDRHDLFSDWVVDAHQRNREEKAEANEQAHLAEKLTNNRELQEKIKESNALRKINGMWQPQHSLDHFIGVLQEKLASAQFRANLIKEQDALKKQIHWHTGQDHPLRKQIAFINTVLDGSLVATLSDIQHKDPKEAFKKFQELRNAWPWEHKMCSIVRAVKGDEAHFMHIIGGDMLRNAETALLAREDLQKECTLDVSLFTKKYLYKQMCGDVKGLERERTYLRTRLSGHEHNDLYSSIAHYAPSDLNFRTDLGTKCQLVHINLILDDPITRVFCNIAHADLTLARKEVLHVLEQFQGYCRAHGIDSRAEAREHMIEMYGYDPVEAAHSCFQARTDYNPHTEFSCTDACALIFTTIKHGSFEQATAELRSFENQLQQHFTKFDIKPDEQSAYLTQHKGYDVLAQARSLYEARPDYQEHQSQAQATTANSASSATTAYGQSQSSEAAFTEVPDLWLVSVQNAITTALSTSRSQDTLTDKLALLRDGIFKHAALCNYDIHPNVAEQLDLSIGTIKTTKHAHEIVFHVAIVDRVLGDIQIKANAQIQTQPTVLERSPELLVHGLKKFIQGLNPVTQIKNSVEFWVSTAHFMADITVGNFYLTPEQYQARIGGFWQSVEAFSPENLAQLAAEQWVEMGAQLAADFVYAKGVASTLSYLKEIDAVSKVKRKVSVIADTFNKGFDKVLGKEPVLVTPEGIIWQATPEIQESLVLHMSAKSTKNGTKEIIKDTQGLLNKEKEVVEWARYKSKHAPPPHVPWKDIVKSTKNGVAKYKPGVNIKELELHAWKNGQVVKTGKNWKVFKADEVIGAKWGKETCYMRVECTANTIHGHPIPLEEYLRYLQ
jgi:hypothetical protein